MDKKDEAMQQDLEKRKVVALERIASNLEGILDVLEGIEREGWNERLQYYLSEFYRMRKQEIGEKE